jgi:uncharacterized protein YqiB (DUF1249 family)
MRAAYRKVGSWLQEHPHTLVSLCAGVGIGLAIAIPLGWKLPDSAAALVGALIGAGAAVGGALWAANYKQLQEVLKADEKQAYAASMIASALALEIAAAQQILSWHYPQLMEAIADADRTGNAVRVQALFGSVDLSTTMCTRFVDKLDVFGGDAPMILDAVSMVLNTNQNAKAVEQLVAKNPWTAVELLAKKTAEGSRLTANNLKGAMRLIAKYHGAGAEILNLVHDSESEPWRAIS